MKILRFILFTIILLFLFLLLNRESEIVDKELDDDIFQDMRNRDSTETTFK